MTHLMVLLEMMSNTLLISVYIATFPPEVREVLEKIRQKIAKIVPDAEQTIRYGIPTFRLHEQNLVHFAGFAHHIGFYPTPPVLLAFAQQLQPYKTSKGAVQFPLDQSIPYSLIEEMVQYRLKTI